MNLHATAIAFGERGVLIRGAPGSGKSTLALELIESTGNGLGDMPLQARLVADDQTLLVVQVGMLMASAPQILQNKLEVRGLGIVTCHKTIASAPIVLVVDLSPDAERLPEPGQTCEILGVRLPRVAFQPHSAALAARVRTAFLHIAQGDGAA